MLKIWLAKTILQITFWGRYFLTCSGIYLHLAWICKWKSTLVLNDWLATRIFLWPDSNNNNKPYQTITINWCISHWNPAPMMLKPTDSDCVLSGLNMIRWRLSFTCAAAYPVVSSQTLTLCCAAAGVHRSVPDHRLTHVSLLQKNQQPSVSPGAVHRLQNDCECTLSLSASQFSFHQLDEWDCCVHVEVKRGVSLLYLKLLKGTLLSKIRVHGVNKI